jgi:hypothetical protein
LDNIFTSTLKRDDDGLLAFHKNSLHIAKSGNPHTIREQLILAVVEEVLKNVLHRSPYDIYKETLLSNNIVQRHIDEMGHDVENYLCDYLQTT